MINKEAILKAIDEAELTGTEILKEEAGLLLVKFFYDFDEAEQEAEHAAAEYRDRDRNAHGHEQAARDARERVHRADRQVPAAGDDQKRHADRGDERERRGAEHVDQVLLPQKHAVLRACHLANDAGFGFHRWRELVGLGDEVDAGLGE